jgi:type II secretory ATPase GspE/PulE/Tfp pilus assembly ATPase PilB-like protein
VTTPLMLAEGLSREFLFHHHLCPKERRSDGTIVVAVAPDAILDALDDLEMVYRADIAKESASADEVDRMIERLSTLSEHSLEMLDVGAPSNATDEVTADVRDLATQPPVVRYVNLLIRDAYDAGASDIHIEATNKGLSARFRLDGVLSHAAQPPNHLELAVVSRIKRLAELDIAERRRPQDGRIRVRLESRELDLRVSTVPTMYGESVVLRLLDRGGRPVQLRELGLTSDLRASLERLAARPHGMLLVTGPTGSGKTTTLYACLATRDTTGEKIITVEDPIEYQLPGITQVPVHRQAGVTFGSALRSILRQDPDVVMVGEMRDRETAEIAVQAAMTGHLVFSTLHTNDAVGAIPRLLDLEVPDYLVGATIEAVLAQRLVRRICGSCRATYTPNAESVATVAGRPTGSVRLERGLGCQACRGTGFRGRLGLFELLHMTEELRDAVSRRAPRSALHAIALEQGMRSLRADGWAKIEAGLTTVEEVLRVAHD